MPMRKPSVVLFMLFILVCNLSGYRAGSLKVKKVSVCGRAVFVEIADNSLSRMRGLMFRRELAWNRGMLFVYSSPRVLKFWMKNTYIDLDIGFFDEQCVLRVVKSMKKHDETTVSSDLPVVYALEVNKGWFKKSGIKVGCKLVF